MDVDNMWTDLMKHSESIAALSKDFADAQEYAEKMDENIQIHQNELDDLTETSESHSESIAALSKDFANAEEYAVESRNLIYELQDFRAGVSEIEHLKDVDSMWKDVAEHTFRLAKSERSVGELTAVIQKHQKEVTETVEKNREETEAAVQKNQEEITATVEKNREEVNEQFVKAAQESNEAIASLTKKVKYAYWIAGGSVGLAVVELILLLVKVM